jgi:hypothetical protein
MNAAMTVNGAQLPRSFHPCYVQNPDFFQIFFFVIDALDECPSVDDTTSKFLLELETLNPSPHLLVTSRSHLKGLIQQFLPDSIHLEIRAHEEDIKRYLDEQIRKQHFLRLLVTGTSALSEKIKSKIFEKAKGMSVSHIDYPDLLT